MAMLPRVLFCQVVNATLFRAEGLASADECAQRCLRNSSCIAFTWHGHDGSCEARHLRQSKL